MPPTAAGAGRRRLSRRALLRFHARCDGCDNGRRHLELVSAVLDPVSSCDPVEIGIGGPDLALIVLEHEQPHRPVEPGIGVCCDELRPERRIAEDKQDRRLKLDPGLRGELRLVDLVEELDAFVRNVLLQKLDRLADRIGALDPDDAVVAGQRGD